ncbi:ly6/PLAUR domain-containing protein 3 [Anomaloglossus baeobatrachus]|uniref:ly6/PLAUR domain-containing protein 3 n=1 Tax=Anomaloglossus baeobatrachus TaxID=238106 RepID=UPI003F50A0B7
MGMRSGLLWKGSTLMVISLVFTLAMKGVRSQYIECYSCTDKGEGSCQPENAANVSCSEEQNVCLETISAIKTSHDNLIVLKRGCGSGAENKQNKTMSFYGISVYIQLNQCNSSLCNSNMNLKNYQLAPEDNVTRTPNDEQCYSCIGKTDEDCLPSNAPVMDCYDTYDHCFDGSVTISIDNDVTIVPVKSCASRYRCAKQIQTYDSASFEIKGACCSGKHCNQDLSNKTQHGDMPYLVLLNENNEPPTTTAAPPPAWLSPTEAEPTTKNTTPTKGESQTDPKTTVASRFSIGPQDNQINNTANRLFYASWLIFLLICLS